MSEWRNERPSWCPHRECGYLRRAQDALCVGVLPVAIYHHETPNTHRLCFGTGTESAPVSFETNASDCDSLRYMMDAIDGQTTSWRSRRLALAGEEEQRVQD